LDGSGAGQAELKPKPRRNALARFFFEEPERGSDSENRDRNPSRGRPDRRAESFVAGSAVKPGLRRLRREIHERQRIERGTLLVTSLRLWLRLRLRMAGRRVHTRHARFHDAHRPARQHVREENEGEDGSDAERHALSIARPVGGRVAY